MKPFDKTMLKQLYLPPETSHKGQNGKLMVIGGSHLFHAASLWALEVASRIVDMVFYSSVPENNAIVQKEKELFRNGIVVPREHIEDYILEADAVLIGPGMVRTDPENILHAKQAHHEEGIDTYLLTKYLLFKYPKKKWIIDAGALQMIEREWLSQLSESIITPHPLEFQRVFGIPASPEDAGHMAKRFQTIILLKGKTDIVCSAKECSMVEGGNAGMTKGGTGDVLSGLLAALATKNSMWLSAVCGSYINKKAGDRLYKRVGYYFNATDLVNEIPAVMKELVLDS